MTPFKGNKVLSFNNMPNNYFLWMIYLAWEEVRFAVEKIKNTWCFHLIHFHGRSKQTLGWPNLLLEPCWSFHWKYFVLFTCSCDCSMSYVFPILLQYFIKHLFRWNTHFAVKTMYIWCFLFWHISKMFCAIYRIWLSLKLASSFYYKKMYNKILFLL